jgi:hypothetical protein
MRATFGFWALAGILLLTSGSFVSARKKEPAAPGETYLGCLQRGLSAAPQDDPARARVKVLADCLFIRRGTATVTEALLILDGESQKHASADVERSLADDDRKGLGISRQDDAAIFAAYGEIEKQLANAKADYRIHADGQLECVLTQSSGNPEVDATKCQPAQGCPSLDPKPGANNNAALICMDTEQRRQLFLLSATRAGFESPSANGAPNTPNH